MTLDARRVEALIGEVLGIAKAAAPRAETSVSVASSRDANTRFARNEITSAGDVDDTTVAITVAIGKRHATTSTNQTDRASLERAVDRAVQVAQLAPEDPERMPVLGRQKYVKAADAWDASTSKLGADARAAAARTAIEQAATDKLAIAGFYAHTAGVRGLGTSAGLRVTHRATSVQFSMTARTADATGSGWSAAVANQVADVDAPALAKVAIDKAVRSAKPRKLDPGRYTVVLEPAAVGDLVGFLTGSLDARRADEGRSFFSRPGGGNRLGEKLFGDAITLRSDPTSADTPAAPFDGEGMPLAPTTWIEKGVVKALVYSRYWADKQKVAATGQPSTFHLHAETADATPDLLAGVKRGVLVTRFWYLRSVDPQTLLVTGLTRDGVFLIENGQVVAPVNNFRFNDSPATMLAKADAFTKATVRVGRSLRVPGLRTHDFNFASVSDAV
jgi:predicted Zn-dependent protease